MTSAQHVAAGERTSGRRVACAGLSRRIEAGDRAGRWAVDALGEERLWELLCGAAPTSADRDAFTREVVMALGEPVPAADGSDAPGRADGEARARLAHYLERWTARGSEAPPERDLANAARLGGGLLIPGDEQWPGALDDLGDVAPLALWWRGTLPPVRGVPTTSEGMPLRLAVVGTRDPSAYGRHVARELACGLAQRGWSIVSGGALGIDAIAHTAALDAAAWGGQSGGEAGADPALGPPATICVSAGGIDRLYPAANARLLSTIARDHLLLSEYPPGSAPTRWRFLARNRLIAGLSAGTLVVEGRWRSGSLSTAHHAASIGRWLGAVPGAITSATSEGPHRLLREGNAELVTRIEDVLEAFGAHTASVSRPSELDLSPTDRLDEMEQRLWESLPLRGAVGTDRLLTVAGVGPMEGLAALHRLLRKKVIRQGGDGAWSRSTRGMV